MCNCQNMTIYIKLYKHTCVLSIVKGNPLKTICFNKTRVVFKKKHTVFIFIQSVFTCFCQATNKNKCVSYVFYLFSIQFTLFLSIFTCYSNDNGGFYSLIAAGKSSPFVCARCTFDFSRKYTSRLISLVCRYTSCHYFIFHKKFCIIYI